MEDLNAKEVYDAKKKEREEGRLKVTESNKKKKSSLSMFRWIFWLVVLALVVFGIYFLAKMGAPSGEDFSVDAPIEGREHVGNGVAVSYQTNPPTSGSHYSSTMNLGFYDVDELVDDRNVVHNLEHGHVWITYKPNVSTEVKEELKQFDKGVVIISARSENDKDIGLSAWGRVDSFDVPEDGVLDTKRIEEFIKRYQNRGPESGVPSSHR